MNRQGKLDPSALEPGPFRAGKYHLGKTIGEGGFGVVYSATQVELGRAVAIKFIKGRDPEMHERFRREAQLMAMFRSTHVVKVHEFGVDDPVEQGQAATGVPYVVMEYVEGLTLHDWVQKYGPLSALSAATVLRQLLEVLAEARHLGVVHRDIKPQNIILTPPRSRISSQNAHAQARVGDAVLLDFGIAGWTNTQQPSELTRTGVTLGTLRYIAPECFSASDDSTVGQRSDHKTDLYALGLTTYYMLLGQEPFAELDQTQILRRQQDYALNNQNPLRLAFVDGPGLAEVINKLAHPDRAQRYDTAEEVLTHLERLSNTGVTFEVQAEKLRIPLDLHGMEATERSPAGSFGPRKINFESIAPLGDMELHRQLSERLRPAQRPATLTASIARDDEEEGEQTPAQTPRARERAASRQTGKAAPARSTKLAPVLALGIPLLLAVVALLVSRMGGRQDVPEQALAALAPKQEPPLLVVEPPGTELAFSAAFVDASRAIHLANSMALMTAEALTARVDKNKAADKQAARASAPEQPKSKLDKESASISEAALIKTQEPKKEKPKDVVQPEAKQPEAKQPEAKQEDADGQEKPYVRKRRKVNPDYYLDI